MLISQRMENANIAIHKCMYFVLKLLNYWTIWQLRLSGFLHKTQCCHLPVHECILKQWRHRVDVILAHLANVLEHEGERLEDAILYIQLRHTVLIHEAGQHGEWGARLGNDRYGNSGTDTVLSLLYLQVVEKCGEDVVWPADRDSGVTHMLSHNITCYYSNALAKLEHIF